MESEDLETLQKRLSEAKVHLAMRKEANLAQAHSLKSLNQEHTELSLLLAQSPTFSARLSLPSAVDSPQSQQQSKEERDNCQKWTLLLQNWKEEQTKKICRLGVPASLRSQVWRKVIGNSLHITHQLYYILLNRLKNRACEERDKAFGAKVWEVYSVLTSSRPDLLWPDSLLELISLLLHHLSPPDVFIALSNLYSKSRLLSGLQTSDSAQVAVYYSAFESRVAKYCPQTWARLWEAGIHADGFLTQWLESLFVRALSEETVKRVWDAFFVEGDEFLLKVALALIIHWETSGSCTIPDFLQHCLYQPSLSASALFQLLKRLKLS